MTMQVILKANDNYKQLEDYLKSKQIKSLMLVCGNSIRYLKLNDFFKSLPVRLGIQVERFSDFQPNPLYESVVKGVELLHEKNCDAIIGVGGGSAMDVAKCIKLYANMDPAENYLNQEIAANDIRLLAIPTTAGTGSEATRYAVIYYKGNKQSVVHSTALPEAVVMDPSVLTALPLYQKKATMMDAFCHAIESYWSVNSTDESKIYSEKAMRTVMKYKIAYLVNTEEGNAGMLEAANLAGKAINITQTTAGHAMCYKLTSFYGIPHGHAAALCVGALWPFMAEHTGGCIDPRGEQYLKDVFAELAGIMGCEDGVEAAMEYARLLDELGLEAPDVNSWDDYAKLKTSVNPVRLKNNPVQLDESSIDMLYHKILEK